MMNHEKYDMLSYCLRLKNSITKNERILSKVFCVSIFKFLARKIICSICWMHYIFLFKFLCFSFLFTLFPFYDITIKFDEFYSYIFLHIIIFVFQESRNGKNYDKTIFLCFSFKNKMKSNKNCDDISLSFNMKSHVWMILPVDNEWLSVGKIRI